MEIGNLKRRLIAGTGVTFLGSCATIFFGLLLTLVLGRALDLAAFGLMSLALSTVSLTTGLLDVRFGEAVTKFGTDFMARGDNGKALGLILFSYLVELCLAVIAFAVLFFPAPLIARYILCKPEITRHVQIVAFVPLVAFSSATSVAVLRTFNRFNTITAGTVFAGICRLAFPVAICLLWSRDIRFILIGYVLSALVATVAFTWAAVITIRRRFSGVPSASIRSDLREIVPFTLQTLLGVILKNLARGDLAMFIVARYRSDEELSYLKLGLQVGGMLTIVPSAVGFVTFPSFAELWAKGEKKMLLHVIAKISKLLALLLGTGGLLIVAVAPLFIRIWKSDFMPAMNVIYWLVAAAVVDGVCCWIRPAALSLGKPWISTLVNFVRMIVLVGLGFLLVPWIGYVGIGVATLALSVSSISLGAWLVIKSILGEQPNDQTAQQAE